LEKYNIGWWSELYHTSLNICLCRNCVEFVLGYEYISVTIYIQSYWVTVLNNYGILGTVAM